VKVVIANVTTVLIGNSRKLQCSKLATDISLKWQILITRKELGLDCDKSANIGQIFSSHALIDFSIFKSLHKVLGVWLKLNVIV